MKYVYEEISPYTVQIAPENSIYIKPTEILTDIFNYFIESENNKSVQDSTYNPIQDEEVTKPVSPETTGCFPQSEQGVSPEVDSTISIKERMKQ